MKSVQLFSDDWKQKPFSLSSASRQKDFSLNHTLTVLQGVLWVTTEACATHQDFWARQRKAGWSKLGLCFWVDRGVVLAALDCCHIAQRAGPGMLGLFAYVEHAAPNPHVALFLPVRLWRPGGSCSSLHTNTQRLRGLYSLGNGSADVCVPSLAAKLVSSSLRSVHLVTSFCHCLIIIYINN